jgi:ubiquinone/menaquinone biosynthesis C-methylase UbiE
VSLLQHAYGRLLHLGFRLLYNELAWTYDAVSWSVSLGQWREWQRASLPHLTGSRILEIAFGTGNLQLDLHAAGKETFGIDLSPHMVRIASGKLRRRRITGRLCRASAGALPFATASFDSLVATFPTPFIRDRRVLAEMARVLRSDGHLIIVDGTWLLQPHWAARTIEWLYRATGQGTEAGPASQQWLEQAGWRATEKIESGPRAVVHLILADPPARAPGER